MANLLLDVIFRNNDAVREMLRGDFDTSSESLRNCLSMVRKCLEERRSSLLTDDDGHHHPPPGGRNHPSARRGGRREVVGQLNQYVLSHSTQLIRSSLDSRACSGCLVNDDGTSMSFLKDDQFFIYNKPIVFGRGKQHERLVVCLLNESTAGSSMERICGLLSACIIFNMALVCHARSRLGVPRCLEKAQKLYHSVVTVVVRKLEDHDSSFSAVHHVLTQHGFLVELGLVALNNYLQVSMQLNDCYEQVVLVESGTLRTELQHTSIAILLQHAVLLLELQQQEQPRRRHSGPVVMSSLFETSDEWNDFLIHVHRIFSSQKKCHHHTKKKEDEQEGRTRSTTTTILVPCAPAA